MILAEHRDTIVRLFGEQVYNNLENAASETVAYPVMPECHIAFDDVIGIQTKEINGVNHFRANVCATAILSSDDLKVYYMIKWNHDSSKPGGNHLGQCLEDLSNKFILDRTPEGELVTEPYGDIGEEFFSQNKYTFYFEDKILQRNFSGIWTFKIQIRSNDDTRIICEESVEIDWNRLMLGYKQITAH